MLVANLATHPAVWFIWPELLGKLGLTRRHRLELSELWAFGLEAWLYSGSGVVPDAKRAVLASAAANAVSFALGVLLLWR